jgi:hypothetical protein
MTRPSSRGNFSAFFFFRTTQTNRVISDILLFFAITNGRRRKNGGEEGINPNKYTIYEKFVIIIFFYELTPNLKL